MPAARPAGQYSERVTIEAPAAPQGQSPSGDPGDSWRQLYAGVPAAVLVVGGAKRQTARQVAAEVQFTVQLRARPGLAADQRVSWRARLGYVQFVEDDAGTDVILHCTSEGR